MKRKLFHTYSLVIVFILFATTNVFCSDTLLIQKQQKSVLADAAAAANEGKFLLSYSPCGKIDNFICNDVLNTGNSLFSDLSQVSTELRSFNESQSNTILWIFSGRFYFKYSELQATQNLSEDELVEIIPPSGQSLVVRPEEVQNKVYSMQALGLNTLGSDVLNIVKQRHPGKKILILFITESFIASPQFNIDGTTKEISVEALSLTQKNMFFKQFGLDQETKTLLNQTFHRSYLDELDKLDNTNDTDKRNKWLASTTKDLVAVLNNNTDAFASLPTSPRERAYAYALERAQYNPASIVGYDEFKPGGYRYNYNALYNAKGYFDNGSGRGVVAGPPIDGVSCPPNYIWNGTTAIAGIININASEPACTRVTDAKLILHYAERAGNNLSEQIANAVEFSLIVEAKLSLNGKTLEQLALFDARKNLLLHLIQATSTDDSYMYAYTDGPFNLRDLTLRPGTRQIVIKPRPITGPGTPQTNPPSPRPSPIGLRMNILLAAAAIVDESIQAGREAYNLNKSVELLFGLYNALDAASSIVDFEQVKNLKLIEPSKNDRELFEQVKYQYEHERNTMTKEEVDLYFWLLCLVELDCSGYNVIDLNTINQDLKGSPHPETGVYFVEKIIEYNGKRYRGVFPKFQYLFRLKLPEELFLADDPTQFSEATKYLNSQIKIDPILAEKFTSEQLEDIAKGKGKIRDLTWHHNEEVGILELVDESIHTKTGHTGGRNIWGGGSTNR